MVADNFSARLLGYDPALLRQMSPDDRGSLASLCNAWLISVAILAYPLALSLWLVTHSMLLAFGLGLGSGYLVINLLRLIHAGGGIAPGQLSHRVDYQPSLIPSLMIGTLALMLSQPAQLSFAGRDVESAVAAHRTTLIATHQESLSALGMENQPHFAEEIARNEFVLLRLALTWRQPEQAVAWTFVYVLLVLLPALLARSLWIGGVQAFERLRYARAEVLIEKAHARTCGERDALLSSWSTFSPSPHQGPHALKVDSLSAAFASSLRGDS